MDGTRTHRQSRPGFKGEPANPAASPVYWGWSHQNGRMEMMDLPAYIDSFRQGYDTALQDLWSRIQTLTSALGSPGAPPYAYQSQPATQTGHGPHRGHRHWHGGQDCGCGHHGHHGHEHHGHHEHHGNDCDCHEHERGCGHDRDCRCECCIGDADIVVYAHCGEVRVVPIQIHNDTRKVREDVSVDLSEVRSSGGRTLPWQTMTSPVGPLTLEPCSTTTLELLVQINCGSDQTDGPRPQGSTDDVASADDAEQPEKALEHSNALLAVAERRRDVDGCEVGYVTIRLGGCLVRPIVVAIAALPDVCGSYRTGCSCSCCC
jgi:hypothetical protein